MSQKVSTFSEVATFFSAFVKNPASVGALFPASRYLANAMMEDIDLAPNDVLMELGPGTGSITHSIACFENPFNYIGVEREQEFIELLSVRFPELDFVHGLAESAFDIYRAKHAGSPKAIISSLPFASLTSRQQDDIIENLDQLMSQGSVFRTYQYLNAYFLPSGFKFRKRMAKKFGPPATRRIELFNLPPAVVFTWKR